MLRLPVSRYLWELNKIGRQVNRLKNYYMRALTAVCEIKILIPSENYIHFVVRNNNVKSFESEMKDFLFQL